jgi:hypothetical protein
VRSLTPPTSDELTAHLTACAVVLAAGLSVSGNDYCYIASRLTVTESHVLRGTVLDDAVRAGQVIAPALIPEWRP